MLQKVMDLFNIVLFGEYLVVSIVFSIVMIKLYLCTLKRINDNKSYKIFIGCGVLVYAIMIAFLIYTIVHYGYLSVTVTSVAMYIVMYYPMKKITTWVENKVESIIVLEK